MHDMSVYHTYLTTVDQFGTCQLYLKIFTWPIHSQFPLLKDKYLIYIYLILPLSICIFYMMYWCTFFPLHPPFSDTEVLPTTTTGSTSVGLAQVPSNGSHGALGLPGATGRQLLWPWRSWIASCSNLKLESVPALQLLYFHNFALKMPHGCRCHFLVQTVWSDLIGYSASCCHPVPGNLGLLGQGYHDAAQEIGPKHCFPRVFAKVIKMICEHIVHIATRCTRKGTRTTEIWCISYVFQFMFNSISIHIFHMWILRLLDSWMFVVRPSPSRIPGGATGCAGGVAGDCDAAGENGACPRHPLPPSNERNEVEKFLDDIKFPLISMLILS